MLRGRVPLLRLARAMPSWVKKIAVALLGRVLIPEIPFEPAFFRVPARRIMKAVHIPVFIIGAGSVHW